MHMEDKVFSFHTLKTNHDLWDLFTKSEEYDTTFADEYGRFPYYLSQHRHVFEPEVSAFLLKNGLSSKYPDNKKFAVCLTHDIDRVHFPIVTVAKEASDALLQGRLTKSLSIAAKNSGKLFLSTLDRNLNPSHNFDRIMNLESRYGAKSSFYFLLANKQSGFDGCNIDRLRAELREIVDSGWEVGLHGSSEAYLDLEIVKSEKMHLEQVVRKPVVGYRNHYLSFKLPRTWEILQEAGFKYDSTFGYADCAGFRNGMCHPFQPFNLKTGRQMDIWEIPLVIMDETLEGYMHLDMNKAWQLTTRLIDTVESHQGVITILWHNTSMLLKIGTLYQRILEYCYNKQAWMTSAEEIWRRVSENGH